MKKLNCEIIKDLLPSYVDGLCSKESKEIIEEHLSECSACSKVTYRMKETQIVSHKAEEKELDYMKKVKKHIAKKNLISLELLIGFIVIGMAVIIGNYGNIPIGLYYAVLPVLMLGSHFMLSDHTSINIKTKWKTGMSGLGLLLTVYSIMLEFLLLKWAKSGIYPFGMKAENAGPFVYQQFLAIAVVLTAIFIITIILSVKTANSHGMLLNISITGSCLSFAFISLLKSLDTVESFAADRNNTILLLAAESIIIALILSFLEKRRIQKMD